MSAARVRITGAVYNVRSGPGTGFPIIGKVYAGQRFVTFGTPASGAGCSGTWHQMDVPGNATSPPTNGWVCGDGLVVETAQVTTTGVFVNPDGPSGMVVSGVGTSHFSWGTPQNQGAPPCSLSFIGTNFLTSVGLQFPIGTLTYTNSITSGDNADLVALRVSVAFASPAGVSNTQEFIFRLVNTPHTSGGSADADIVRLVTPFASDLISVGGRNYGLRLSFGQVTESGFAEIDELFVLEEHSATAELRAELIAAVPISVVAAGVFTNPTGPSGMAVSGVGTSHFTWGVAVPGSSSNRFDLIGTNISAFTEQPITLASLSYFNGGIYGGTEATSVVMLLTLNFPSESLTTNLPFRIELVGTLNTTNDVRASADIVRLVNPLPPPVVRLSGVDYALRLGFGTVSTNGFSNVEEFAVEEDRTANVTIRGVFSRFIAPQPEFSVTLRRQSRSYLLTWPTSVARRYQVQTATNLLDFIPLSGEITATSSTTAFVDTNASARFKFYRVVQLP